MAPAIGVGWSGGREKGVRMAQELRKSVHMLEMFMPYRDDERRMLEALDRVVDLGYYEGVELPVFFDRKSCERCHRVIESNGLFGGTSVTPYVKDQGLSLADLDADARRKAVGLVKTLTEHSSECGYTNLCVPSGDDPGAAFRGMAKVALADSMVQIADHIRPLGMNLTIEPLDRYAYKRQLIGPMEEDVVWFEPIHEQCPNAFIHWDSAHESLGGIDLMESLELCRPFLAQLHLCDAICDPSHPCFGDLHMDCAVAPDWETEGFLTPEVGARILEKASSFDKPAGVSDVYVSVEIHGHPGSHLWTIEEHGRAFLQHCLELAGLA